MARAPRILACTLPVLLAASFADGAIVNVGLVSFDKLIPGDSSTPGVNVFNISNFTGDPALGGFALPPDFNIFDLLILTNASLTVSAAGAPTLIALPGIGPGSLSPTDPVQFPDTTSFESAEFKATLNSAMFLLANGDLFVADSTTIDSLLLPSGGNALTAGADFAVITVSGTEQIPAAPEPQTTFLAALALGLIACRRLRPGSRKAN